MTKFLVVCLVGLPSFAFGTEVTQSANPTATAKTASTAPYFTAGGEGKTLPEDVMRFRLPVRLLRGDKFYNEDGVKQGMPYDIAINAGAVVLEYGLTDRLSLQLKTNVYQSQKVSAKSDSDILNSDMVKSNVAVSKESQLNGLAGFMALNGTTFGCTTVAACRSALAAGFKVAQNTTLPSGAVLPANVPWQAAVEGLVEQGAIATVKAGEISGKAGIGDTDVGALYAILTKEESAIAVSAGAGLRLPTGTMIVNPGEQATGRGTTDLGLRLNIDYPPVPGLMLSWQNQSEIMLLKGTKGTPDNKVDIERVGVRNIGFVKTAFGLGMVEASLAPVGLYASYNYDLDSNAKVGGTYGYSLAPRIYSATFGTTLDGLALQLPLQLELEYEMAVGGRNAVGLVSMGTTFKAFYRF